MQNIRIKNAGNGGFLITEDHELYGTPIAALSNSGDLLRWMTDQFIKPKEEPIFPHFKPMLDRVLASEENATPEPEQDGFITKEPEWVEWDGDEYECPIGPNEKVLYICVDEPTFVRGPLAAGSLDWRRGKPYSILRYRVLS